MKKNPALKWGEEGTCEEAMQNLLRSGHEFSWTTSESEPVI